MTNSFRNHQARLHNLNYQEPQQVQSPIKLIQRQSQLSVEKGDKKFRRSGKPQRNIKNGKLQSTTNSRVKLPQNQTQKQVASQTIQKPEDNVNANRENAKRNQPPKPNSFLESFIRPVSQAGRYGPQKASLNSSMREQDKSNMKNQQPQKQQIKAPPRNARQSNLRKSAEIVNAEVKDQRQSERIGVKPRSIQKKVSMENSRELETPKAKAKGKEVVKEKEQQKEEEKPKGNCKFLLLILNKIQKSKKKENWDEWKEEIVRKKRKQQQYRPKLKILEGITNSLQNKHKQNAMMRLKRILGKSKQVFIKNSHKLSTLLQKSSKQALPNLIRLIQRHKFIQSWNMLKQRLKNGHMALGMKALNKLQQRRLSSAFVVMKNNKSSKNKLVQALSIIKYNHMQIKSMCFGKMFNLYYKHSINNRHKKKDSTVQVQQQAQKVQQAEVKVIRKQKTLSIRNSKEQKLQRQLKEQRNKYNLQRHSIIEQIDLRKHETMQLKELLQMRTKNNKEFKNTLDILQINQNDSIIEFSEKQETKLIILFDIYIYVFKYVQGNIIPTTLIEDFPILQSPPEQYEDELGNSQNSIIMWKTLQENLQLKRKIQVYEGTSKGQRKVAKMIHEEQVCLEGLVRNYLRERYVWEWIKVCLSNSE